MKIWLKFALTVVATMVFTGLFVAVLFLSRENRQLRQQLDLTLQSQSVQSSDPAGQTYQPQQETEPQWEPAPSSPETLRAEISTLEEVSAFFDARWPSLYMSAHLTDGVKDYWWLDSGERITQRATSEVVGRSCVVNAATYLLSDDMEIYTVIGFRSDGTSGYPMMAINCIRTEGGYLFRDPVLGMQGDIGSRFGSLLPEAEVATVEEYLDLILSDPGIRATLDSLYFFEGGEGFEFYEDPHGLVTLKSPQIEPVYRNTDKQVADALAREQAMAHVKPENIGSYALSHYLGGTTLTPEQAYALVDADPETVKAAVKTTADVLMYMLAAQLGDNGGCYCTDWDGWTWHTNFSAKEVMEKKLTNCGASANLANYLLEDDYEEVGFILHAYYPGNGGGHVYNYFLFEGKYYIVDFSWYMFNNYIPSQDFPVLVLDRLEDYTGDTIGKLYGGVCLALAHTSTGQHLPNIFGEQYGDNHYYVPEGSDYILLYESGDGYLLGEKPLDKRHYDYTVYWPGYQYS